MALLANRFAPLTFQVGFIRADLDAVVGQYIRWQHLLARLVTRSSVTGSLESKLERILPLDDDGQRVLFSATQSPWTAVFDNRIEGGRNDGIVAVVSERLGVPGLVACDIPNTFDKSKPRGRRGMWGAIAIAEYGVADTGVWGFTRSVSLRNDVSGWRFHQLGRAWPFEDMARYEAPGATRRFDVAMLSVYCERFGIRLGDERFYEGAGIATRSTFLFLPARRSLSLAERQLQIGIGAARTDEEPPH